MVHSDDLGAAVDDTEIVDGAKEQEAVQETEEIDLYPDDKPEQDTPVEGEEEGEEDEEAGDEEGEEEPEPENVPVSLNAEEREKFKGLPEEARDFVVSAIKRREDAAQQGVAKAIETQRQAEREAADRVAQTQQGFARQFAELVTAFAPQPPPTELARQNPAEYQYLKARYDEEVGSFQQLVGQIQGIDKEASQHFEQQQTAWREERAKKLMSDPDFAQAEDKNAYFGKLLEFGSTELGYDVDGLVKDAEAADFINIKRAMRWKEKADKWDSHLKKRNERPRKAKGRFASTAPSGTRAPATQAVDTLKTLYPND